MALPKTCCLAANKRRSTPPWTAPCNSRSALAYPAKGLNLLRCSVC